MADSAAVMNVEEATVRANGSAEKALADYRNWLALCTRVCDNAAKGNLEMRLLHSDTCGEFTPLMRSINHLLDMTDAFMRESFAALEHAGQGKFYRRVLLRGMLGSFRNTSQLINRATDNMAKSAGALRESEERRQALAGQFEGTVKSVVAALLSSAEQVKSTALQLSESAGSEVVDQKSAGKASADQKQQLNSVVGRLTDASQKIGGVVKLITEIAAQTNLLALNATIEAARAGEAGKGFAVVASEVKSLARQTTDATEGISREITSMRGTASRTAELVNQMSHTIRSMTELSDQLSHNAEELSSSVEAFLQSIRS